MNVIQQMCYYMCCNCVRTNKIISIPSPVRYADLCAYRSKLHVEHMCETHREDLSSGRLNPEDLIAQVISKLNGYVKINEAVRNKLYYC